MKTKHFKVIVIMIIVVAMGCVLTYAEKSKDKKVSLPAAVTDAISSMHPGAVVKEANLEEEETKVYEVVIEQNGQEIELTIAPDGTVVEVTTEVAVKDLPPAVARAITDASGGARIEKVENEVTYAVVKIVKLDTPSAGYEAKLVKDSMKSEIKVSADGKVLEQPKCKAGDDDEDDDDNGGEEDDD
ncbi:MAG: PepSY-like domain-containing protein [Planctomycetota bacterium]